MKKMPCQDNIYGDGGGGGSSSFCVETEKPTTSRKGKLSANLEIATPIGDVGANRSFSNPNFGTGKSPSFLRSLDFDLQEKVSVRLVENQGLVVDHDLDEGEEDDEVQRINDSSCARTASFIKSGRARRENGGIRRNTVGTDFRIGSQSPQPHEVATSSSKISSNNNNEPPKPSKMVPTESESTENRRTRIHHFSRTRNGGSTSPVGVSSLVPLMSEGMGIKESHKIEVVIKPPPNMMKNYSGSNIHLCCALVFVFSASIFSSLTLLLVKVLENRDHHPISVAFWRYMGILIPSIPLTLFYIVSGKKDKLLGSVWPIHEREKLANVIALLMRGVLGASAIILRYCSLNYVTMANTTVIGYSAPVFAAIFAPFCFKRDRAGFVPVLFGVFACLGIFLLTHPPFLDGGGIGWNKEILQGVILSSLSMLCSSSVLICLRYLLQNVHFSLMLLVLGFWGSFEAGVLSLSLEVLKVPELLPDIVMILGMAVLSFFGQLFLLLAMRMGHVGSTSVMKSCDIFLTFVWQYLFLKTKAETFEILSALLIILSVWLICFRKWLSGLGSKNVIRNKFSFLLF